MKEGVCVKWKGRDRWWGNNRETDRQTEAETDREPKRETEGGSGRENGRGCPNEERRNNSAYPALVHTF